MIKTSPDLSELTFDANGLIPAIVQDAENGEVLMMAWMNAEAVQKTFETGLTHFYSRSRRKLWQKGETSGHVQKVKEILFDCDADCLLVKAHQVVAACHTGHRSCFYNVLGGGPSGAPVFDAEKVYRTTENQRVVERLFEVILDRRDNPRGGSYTSLLLTDEGGLLGSKVLEEAGELVQAAASHGAEEVVGEAADLAYHAMVLLARTGVSPHQVKEELRRRFGKSGIQEKAERKGK